MAATTTDPQRLAESLNGRIAPVRVSPLYAVSLGVVALLMVLLPLVYLGLIGATAWAWWHYATHPPSIGIRNAKIMAVVYLGPLTIGAVLILFMLKPLFARAPAGADPVSLDPRRQSALFAFVRRLCTAVGAPFPSRIDVTCEVNASASFRRGWRSMLGDDLVLTIGLNLVAGQNLRQFAGVLAHEFGHFAQGWAMRANYLVRSVNMWFARVVYQRDAWDEWLVEMSTGDSHLAINLVLGIARLMVWATRRVLWVLMMIGHLFSSLLSRQMEFDADRHAARLVGSEAFASALRELPVLAAAEHGAHSDLRSAWQEGRLADDLPALVRANLGQIPAPLRQQLIEQGLQESAGMYASHPATRDRIAACAREGRGLFAADGPASALFHDFPALARSVTTAFYRDEVGLPVQAAALVPTAHLLAAGRQRQDEGEAAERLIGPLWQGVALFAPADPAEAPADPAQLARRLEGEERRLADASTAHALLGAGLRINHRDFGLPQATAAAAEAARERALAGRRECRAALGRAAGAAAARLAAAQGDEPERLRAVLATLADRQQVVDELRLGHQVLDALFAQAEGRDEDRQFTGTVINELGRQQRRLAALCGPLAGIAYPFPHSRQGVDLAAYLMPAPPSEDDPAAVMGAAEQALRNLYELHARALNRLAALAAGPAAAG